MSEWKEDSVKEFADSFAGGTPSRSRSDYYNGDIPWISSGEINRPYIVDTAEKITQIGLDNSSTKWIPANSVLVAMYGATAGQVSKNLIKATANQAVLALIPKKDLIDDDFLYYQIKNNKESILYLAQGSGQPNLSKDLIDNFKISVPKELPTQRKIARILSTADAVIEKTGAAIAKYKAIKQGMLHDLFTRGIDTQTGKLRPKYEDAPELYKNSKLGWIPKEWEVLTVADVSENLDGRRIPVKQEDRDKQAKIYPYYGASGIIDYVEDYIFDEPLILLGEDGENVVSRNLPLAFKVEGKYWVNNHAHVLKPLKDISTIDFLCEALEYIDYSTIVSGSAQPKITQGHLSKIHLRIPEIKEQIQIGNRLSSIGHKIQTEQTYLHKLQQIKAGLMADLLSGKKEVVVEEKTAI